jgi:hypothetical protein
VSRPNPCKCISIRRHHLLGFYQLTYSPIFDLRPFHPPISRTFSLCHCHHYAERNPFTLRGPCARCVFPSKLFIPSMSRCFPHSLLVDHLICSTRHIQSLSSSHHQFLLLIILISYLWTATWLSYRYAIVSPYRPVPFQSLLGRLALRIAAIYFRCTIYNYLFRYHRARNCHIGG